MNPTIVLITAEDDNFEVVQIVVDITETAIPEPARIITIEPANYDRFFKAKPPEPKEDEVEKPKRIKAPSKWEYENLSEQELIVTHLPLVRMVVEKIKLNLPSHIDADDLHSVGVIGLMAAVKKFNREQSVTFRAYAVMRIRGKILDELRAMDSMPRRARAMSRKIQQTAGEIEQALQREATSEEIAEKMGVTVSKFEKLQKDSTPLTFVAIDQLSDLEDHNGASLHEMIADQDDHLARDLMEDDENRRIIAARVKDLPDIPKKILAMYYFEGMKLHQIAALFSLTESRICQIHQQTLQWLRAIVKKQRDR